MASSVPVARAVTVAGRCRRPAARMARPLNAIASGQTLTRPAPSVVAEMPEPASVPTAHVRAQMTQRTPASAMPLPAKDPSTRTRRASGSASRASRWPAVLSFDERAGDATDPEERECERDDEAQHLRVDVSLDAVELFDPEGLLQRRRVVLHELAHRPLDGWPDRRHQRGQGAEGPAPGQRRAAKVAQAARDDGGEGAPPMRC